jgi:hypothetical protein
MNDHLLTTILAGVVVSLPYLAYVRRNRRHARRLYGFGLIAAALIYVAFAAGASNGRAVGVELGGVALFSLLAWVGMRFQPLVLAAGWACHVAWDLAVHPIAELSYAPWWYPPACVGFDLFVAGFVAAAFVGRRG